MPGSDNWIELVLSESSVDAANNRSLVHWIVRFHCQYGVNAAMTGNAYVNGNLVWSYAGNPGNMTYGNTYDIASGDIWIGHDGAGNGSASGSVHLQTNTTGSTWSFNINGSGSCGLSHIVLPPGAPPLTANSALSSTAIRMQWNTPSDSGTALQFYVLRVWTAGYDWNSPNVFNGNVGGNLYDLGGLSPNTAYSWGLAAYNGLYSGVSYGGPVTTLIAAPIAPSAVTVARTSDTSHSISWTRGSQTAGPYASQEVLRRSRVGGVWGAYSVLASLGAATTSYVDTTTVANANYDYQVRATNASGTATSAASGIVWTTPGVPTGQSAAKDASANIVVTWAAPASAPNAADLKYEVSESTDAGATWAVLGTTAAGALTYTHTSPNAALAHTYRIRAIVSPAGLVGSGLASGYVSTNTVQLLTTPAAPTNLQNTPAGTADRAQPIVLTWQHNPIDSTAQTKYTLQHRLAGTTPWTTVGPTTSAVSSYTLPAGTYPTGTAFEWQVMTWGLFPTGSAYSAVATTQISSIPGVSISSPAAGSVVASTSLTVTWTYSDPDGDAQGSWEATLVQGGVDIETRTGATTALTTTFTTRLAETAYSVRVRVRDSRGLWSTPDTKAFTVTYPFPPTPVINTSLWNWMEGTIELGIALPAPAGPQVPAVSLEIWRSIDDGPYVRLVGGLPPDAFVTYVDFTPTVQGKNVYVVTAISALPSSAQSLITVPAATVVTPLVTDGRPGIFLNAGPNFTKGARLATEVTVDAGRLREKVLQMYAGRPLPVEHSGEHVTETWQVSGSLNVRWSQDVDNADSPEDWLALGALEGPFLLRTPALFGAQATYAYVSVDGPTVSRETGGNVQKVSFTATRAEG